MHIVQIADITEKDPYVSSITETPLGYYNKNTILCNLCMPSITNRTRSCIIDSEIF